MLGTPIRFSFYSGAAFLRKNIPWHADGPGEQYFESPDSQCSLAFMLDHPKERSFCYIAPQDSDDTVRTTLAALSKYSLDTAADAVNALKKMGKDVVKSPVDLQPGDVVLQSAEVVHSLPPMSEKWRWTYAVMFFPAEACGQPATHRPRSEESTAWRWVKKFPDHRFPVLTR